MTTDKAFITGGSVFFEQSRKLAEYENRKASVTFNVGPGIEAVEQTDRAMQIAADTVYKALGLTGSPVIVSGSTAVQHAGPAADATAPKSKGGRPPKTPPAETAKPAGDAADFGTAPTVEPPRQISTGETRKDPADLSEFENVAPVITDEALGSAISKKNKAFVDAKSTTGTESIKVLIRKTGVTRYAEVPQAARSQFLTDLDALK